MQYLTYEPSSKFSPIVDCFWTARGHAPKLMKITPDGHPELIFHFGDPYEVELPSGKQFVQPKVLLAGQLSRPLHLKPGEVSDVFGIKFTPNGFGSFLVFP